MKKILVLTNIYPAPDIESGSTPIVHYFTKEWVKMGYDVRVINYSVNFPKFMMWGASLFKKKLTSILGATIRTNQLKEKDYFLDNVYVKRIPLLKYKLHGAFPSKEIDKAYNKSLYFLTKENFSPDIIISHWVNPQLELMDRLKKFFCCKTCYVAHLASAELDRIYSKRKSQDLINNIDVIGFRSAHIKEAFMKKFCFSGMTFLCYSGIPEIYLPKQSVARTFDNIRNFIYVGTLIKRKYPSEIIPALSSAYKNDDFSIFYIGVGSESKQIEKRARLFNRQDSVHLLGYLSRDSVVKYMQKSDVFIMISRNEAFGLVYLEAMAQGLITIASKNEGFDGIIEHGKNGFLCNAGNIGELSNLIKEIRSMTSSQLQQISLNAVETARNLTDSKAAQIYIKAVEKGIL